MKLEFSKIIVIWGMFLTSIMSCAVCFIWYKTGKISPELIDLIKIVGLGVVTNYTVKAGVENYNKIKNTTDISEYIQNDIESSGINEH